MEWVVDLYIYKKKTATEIFIASFLETLKAREMLRGLTYDLLVILYVISFITCQLGYFGRIDRRYLGKIVFLRRPVCILVFGFIIDY